MNKLLTCICLVLVLCCMVGCSEKSEISEEEATSTPRITNEVQEELVTDVIVPTEESEKEIVPTSTPLPSSTPEPTVMPEVVLDENVSREYQMEQAIDTEFTKIKRMVNEGTISGYVRGDTKFLVWKSVAMGINSVKNYKFAIVNYKGEFEEEFFFYDFDLCNGIGDIEHIGSNIFEITTVNNKMMCHNIENDTLFSYDKHNMMYRIREEFSEGYAVVTSFKESYTEKGNNFNTLYYLELILLSDRGETINTGVFVRWFQGDDDDDDGIGKYGNGVFFCDDAFYNKEGVKVLDLSNVYIENEPYFEGDYCWIEYHDFEFVWGAWMDLEGNFKEEAQKLYELNWN